MEALCLLLPMRARQGEVARVVRSIVLAGLDVLDVKPQGWCGRLEAPAILAGVSRAIAYEIAYGRVHQAWAPFDRTRRAFHCRISMRWNALKYSSYSARSASVSAPSVHLSASSSMRAWTSGVAR